ncbi:MAG: DMT family protein [Blastocatellia bacterium]|nr:DMT family protein [Blastocatellia bacterium]
MKTIALLVASNLFMTIAWYGHLKHRETSLWKVILISWGIAFFEYCLQVPANRLGYGVFTAFQLKIIQEVITMVVFIGFAIFYLRQQPTWNILIAMLLILAAVYFAFLPTGK